MGKRTLKRTVARRDAGRPDRPRLPLRHAARHSARRRLERRRHRHDRRVQRRRLVPRRRRRRQVDARPTRRSSSARPGDMPVVGDFNGDGVDEIGVYRDGTWYIDTNGNGMIDDQRPGVPAWRAGRRAGRRRLGRRRPRRSRRVSRRRDRHMPRPARPADNPPATNRRRYRGRLALRSQERWPTFLPALATSSPPAHQLQNAILRSRFRSNPDGRNVSNLIGCGR